MLARLFLLATLPVTWATRQCYIDPGIEAVPGVLPCSNIDNGPDSSCCVAGDICLQNNACWNQRLGITYLYGCTDPTYNHDSCPNKCGYSSANSNWVALIRCQRNVAGNFDPFWACHHADECAKRCPQAPWLPLLEYLPPVECGDIESPRTAFKGPSPIPPFARLPASTFDSYVYFSYLYTASSWVEAPGYTPLFILPISSVLAPSPSLFTVTVAPIPTDSAQLTGHMSPWTTSSVGHSNQTHLGNEQERHLIIGLGAGFGVFVVAIVAGAYLYHVCRKEILGSQNSYSSSFGTLGPPTTPNSRAELSDNREAVMIGDTGLQQRQPNSSVQELSDVPEESASPPNQNICPILELSTAPKSLTNSVRERGSLSDEVYELPGSDCIRIEETDLENEKCELASKLQAKEPSADFKLP